MQRKDKRSGWRKRKPVKRRQQAVVNAVTSTKTNDAETTADDVVTSASDGASEQQQAVILRTIPDDHSMNTVEVNEAALMAEAQAIAETAPQQEVIASDAVETQPVGPTPEEILEGNKQVFTAVISTTANSVMPAWAISPQETDDLSDALARACVLWFPDGMIPPKYLALCVVAGIAGKIVLKRRDPDTGKLKPMKLDDAKPAAATAPRPTEAA